MRTFQIGSFYNTNSRIKMVQPLIRFKNFRGFPNSEDKIETEDFLDASKEIVQIIETFGKLFTPIITDMNGNVNKLTKCWKENPTKYKYLDDMIILNINIDNFASNALLWLKRALQLICIFFENIYNDSQKNENVKIHLQKAYEKTLKPHHGFIVQSTVKIIYNWVPTRSQLIGSGKDHDENIKVLETYLPTMRLQLEHLDELFKKLHLDGNKKV